MMFSINFRKIKNNPALVFRYIMSLISCWKLEEKLVSVFFKNKEEFDSYKKEFLESGVIEELKKKKRLFEKNIVGKTSRGIKYSFGSIRIEEGIRLYCLIRALKPKVLVETGVSNGVSTYFILLALHKNGRGKLYSIDYPEIEGRFYDKGVFENRKGGAVIPESKMPGWIIPKYLSKNWKLILGRSQDKLPSLLKKLRNIDFFLHDSEHSYDCMLFEFSNSFNVLNKGGILTSHDTNMNNSFYDFSRKHNKKIIKISVRTSLIIK